MCTGNGQSGMAGVAGLVNSAQQQVSAATSAPTFAGKVEGGATAANAYTKPIVNAVAGGPPSTVVDPDLQQAWKRAVVSNGRGANVNHGQRRQIEAEQQRRTDLRASYKQLAETRSAEQARVAEAQKQAQVQQQEEAQRQVQLQEQAERDRVVQQQQLARERLATQAASQSMQVLGRAGATTAAPTAQTTRANKGAARVRTTSGSQGLRIGSSATAPGAGLNIGA
jgi:hypothetical protein